MIYTDLEKIYKSRGIENKYALAMIVASRARQLSEQKGRLLDGEGSERYITYALDEVLNGGPVAAEPPAPADAPSAPSEEPDTLDASSEGQDAPSEDTDAPDAPKTSDAAVDA